MKKTITAFILFAAFILFSSSRTDDSDSCGGDGSRKSAGPPSCYAGELPLLATCGSAGCHDDSPINSGTAQLNLDLGGADATYTPNQQYTITVSLSRSGLVRGGFQIVALQDNNISTSPGIITLTEPNRTQRIDAAHAHPGPCSTQNKVWIEHTDGGIDDVVNDSIRWQFNWLAPATDVGSITFYVASVDANKDLDNTGDHVFAKTKTITANPTSVNEIIERDRISLYPNPVSDNLHLSFFSGDTHAKEDKIFITNTIGETVFQSKVVSDISISFLPVGIYVLHIQQNEKISTVKFIRE